MNRNRYWIAGTTSALLSIILPASQGWADTFVWQDTCPSDSWYACCEQIDGCYSNWFASSVGADCDPICPSPWPDAGDSVFLGTNTVYLDWAAGMSDLSTSGVFELRGGQLSVTGTAVFDSTFYFDGGNVTDGSFDISYLVEFRGGDPKGIAAANFNVLPFAIARTTGGGDISMNSSHLTIWSGGTFEFRSDASIVNNPGQGGFDVINGGHLLKDASAGVSSIDVPLFNGNVVDVRTGTLRLDALAGTSGGAFIIEPGAVLEIAGHTFGAGATVLSDGTDGFVRIPDPGRLDLLAGAAPSVPHLRMDPSSQIRGPGDINVTGSFLWFGGGFFETGTVLLSGATGLSGGGDKSVNTTTLVNAGGITWLDAGNMLLAAATLDNDGIFDVLTDADVLGGTINNAGTFTKSASPGETNVGVFTNIGEVYARSGRLTFADFTQTDGVTVLDGGDIGFGDLADFLGGLLTGTGTVFGNVINDGATVSPGLSPGTIVVTATYTQTAAGTLDIEIGGTTPGLEYDQLVVTSVATLDGTIIVTLIDGFVPAIGDTFDVMTYILHDGEFSTVNLPTGVPERRFRLVVDPLVARVEVFSGILGDMNCDAMVDMLDVEPFILALLDPAGYAAAYTECDIDNGNVNEDGAVDGRDLAPFITALTMG